MPMEPLWHTPECEHVWYSHDAQGQTISSHCSCVWCSACSVTVVVL